MMASHPGKIRMDQLADWMAENDGQVRDAATALGWPIENTKKVWQRIRKRLGPQAA